MDLNEKMDNLTSEINSIKTMFLVHEAKEKATLKALGIVFIVVNALITLGSKFLT